MTQVLLLDQVVAEIDHSVELIQNTVKQIPINGGNGVLLIFSVELITNAGSFFNRIPDLMCTIQKANTKTMTFDQVKVLTTTNIFPYYETVQTNFYKEAFEDGSENILRINGDLKNCVPTGDCFPCKAIRGFIGFSVSLISGDLFSSQRVSIRQVF
jgi:hypothetical protein